MRKKKAALVACSDPVPEKRLPGILQVADILREEGLDVEMDPVFFGQQAWDASSKANSLNRCFQDPEMDYIFDVSGGDLANFVLPWLDFEAIGNSRAVFHGYSDLTTIINGIIARTGRPAVNYQIRNVLYEHAQEQRKYLREVVLPGKESVSDLEIAFLRGDVMEGRIVGGNIRCFLKLAGTPYWPDVTGSILLLESMGGGVFQMMTALQQYQQMGVFEKINGILLGTFSTMEAEGLNPPIEEVVMRIVPKTLPIARTRLIGHYTSAKAIMLGRAFVLKKAYHTRRDQYAQNTDYQ
ncbi:MAG: LD-carboxypeptidase [Lachnospiraceae bacterium]|nr:LD-carboxypeptidase [Lachnospiraceae bacterium]